MKISTQKYNIGFYGAIAPWVDIDLLLNLGLYFNVEMIGPLSVKIKIPSKANIVLRKACSHEKTLELASKWSCGLILFKQTKLTNCVDPVKLYEYMALGLPVVATELDELKSLSLDIPKEIRPVFVNTENAVDSITKTIKADTNEKKQLRKSWAFTQTWRLRLDSVFTKIELFDWL